MRVINPAIDWGTRDIPQRRWLVEGLLVYGTVTMLTGDGGVGKTLLMQQLLTACALGQPFLGLQTSNVRGVLFACEDDEDELWRRQADINRHYNTDMEGIADGLRLMPRVGMENALMEFRFKSGDIGKLTPLFGQLRALVMEFGAQLIVIDTAADTFAGNENIRPQVRAFVNAIRRIALDVDGGVILNAHPSLQGISTGSGLSGSTAWSNSVRARAYLTKPKASGSAGGSQDEDEGDPNERLLKTMKSNYGQAGGVLSLRWHEGVFVEKNARANGAVDRIEIDLDVLAALRQLTEAGTRVSPDKFSRTYFTKAIHAAGYCRGWAAHQVESAKERLLRAGRITVQEFGPPSDRRKCLVPGQDGHHG